MAPPNDTIKIIVGDKEKTFTFDGSVSLDHIITKIKVRKKEDKESQELKLTELVVSNM